MDEGFVRHLVESVNCNVCGSLYGGENVQVLGHYNELWFISVHCHVCESDGLVAAMLKKGQIAEIINDLTLEEFERFNKLEKVSMEDLLGMHDFLGDFDGDFAKLFSSECGPEEPDFY